MQSGGGGASGWSGCSTGRGRRTGAAGEGRAPGPGGSGVAAGATATGGALLAWARAGGRWAFPGARLSVRGADSSGLSRPGVPAPTRPVSGRLQWRLPAPRIPAEDGSGF